MQFNISAAIEAAGSIVQGRLQGQLEGQLRQQQLAQQEYERAAQAAQQQGEQESEQFRRQYEAGSLVAPEAQPQYYQQLIQRDLQRPGFSDRVRQGVSLPTAQLLNLYRPSQGGANVPPFPASGGTPGSTTEGPLGGGPGPGLGATADQVREHAGAEEARQYAALNPTPQPVREFAGLQPASPMQSLLQGAVSPQGIQSHRFAPVASHAPAGSGLTLPPQQPSGNAPAAALAAAPAVAAAQGAAQVTPQRPTFMGFPANVGGEKLQAAITQMHTLRQQGRNWILGTTPKDEAERAVFQRLGELFAGPLQTREDLQRNEAGMQELAKYQTPGRDVVERTAETPRQRQVAQEVSRAQTAIEKSEVPPDHPLRPRMQTILEALGSSDPAVQERALTAYYEIAPRIGSGATAYAKHQEIKQQREAAQRAHQDTVDARTQAHNDAVAARQMQLNLGLANAHPSSEAGAKIAAKIAKDQGWGEFTPAQFRAATKGENGKLLGLLGKDVNEKAKAFKQQAGQFTAKDFTQQRWIDLWTHSKVERTRDAYAKAGKSYAALQAAQQSYNRTLHDSITAAGGAPGATGAAGYRDTPRAVTINGHAVTISPASYWEGLRRAVSGGRLTPAEANRKMTAAFGAR